MCSSRRVRADPHEVGRIEGLGLDSLELAELVAQGQHIEVSAGHEPEDVAPVRSSPMTRSLLDGEIVDQGQRPPAGHCRRHGTISNPVSSSTRASDARRSHRSVEDHSVVCRCV